MFQIYIHLKIHSTMSVLWVAYNYLTYLRTAVWRAFTWTFHQYSVHAGSTSSKNFFCELCTESWQNKAIVCGFCRRIPVWYNAFCAMFSFKVTCLYIYAAAANGRRQRTTFSSMPLISSGMNSHSLLHITAVSTLLDEKWSFINVIKYSQAAFHTLNFEASSSSHFAQHWFALYFTAV